MARHRTRASWHALRGSRSLPGTPRCVRSYTPGLGCLEDRTLLSGPAATAPALDLLAVAIPLKLDSPLAATIPAASATFYQISSNVAGKLTVSLQAPGFAARVSLVDANGQPLVQSDGSVPGTGDPLIDVDVPTGYDFVEVQSLGAGGTYKLTADLLPTTPPFQTVPSEFPPQDSPIAVGDFNGQSDLVAPDGIHLGLGDGTFQTTVLAGPLGDPGWSVTAIAVGQFSENGHLDIAFSEISPDGTAAIVDVVQYDGGSQLPLVATFHIDPESAQPDPVAIEPIDFGNGIVDLAVADTSTGNVAILLGDGKGGFTMGPTLAGGNEPTALVAGRFGDGHVDLIVADGGDPTDGVGQGLTVFQDDGPGLFLFSRTIPVGSAPSAIVAGDFNDDGALDLAVALASSDQVSVLLNMGHGTFAAPTSYVVGQVPLSLVAADFGNGHVDLATANENSDDVSVLLGNGDGTFEPELRFGAGTAPGAIVTADFNGDDRADLAVANGGSGDVSVLLGRGDGTFQDQVTNPVASDPTSAVTADLNHDGHVDIVTTNFYSNDISVLLGNGDGTFQAAMSFPAGEHPTDLVVGYFNSDGRLDLAVTDSGYLGHGQGVSILLGNGDGTFQAPVLYAAGMYPSAIVARDFTGNGILDLAVTNRDSNDVSILRGDGHGGFQPFETIYLGDEPGEPESITAGDFTRDGVLDLAVTYQSSGSVSVLKGDGHGSFQPLTTISLDDPSSTIAALASGDFTGHGEVDLAAVSVDSSGQDQLVIFVNAGGGAFDLQPSIELGTGLSPSSIVAAALDGDGPLDLAITDQYSGTVTLLKGDGQGGFSVESTLNVGNAASLNTITAGDFTGDGLPDLAIATQSPNSVAIELNLGSGQFAQPGSVGLAPRNTPLLADLNGDGLPDVAIVDGAGDILFRAGQPNQPGTFAPPVTVNPGDQSRAIAAVITNHGTLLASVDANQNAVSLFAYGNGGWSLVGSLATGVEPAQIVAADLQGNGDDDLVIRNAGDGTLTVYMSDGNGVFQHPISLAVGPGIADVSVADVNQDGLLDILLANQTAGEVEVILNQGAAGFGPPTLYQAGTGLSAVIDGPGTTALSMFSQEATVGVAAAALTAGGAPDLVALNSGSDTLGVLEGLGAGRFANPTSVATNGPAIAVQIADFNQDGNPDLAILGPNGLSIWLGNGKGGFALASTYAVGPDPTGLAIADSNGDKSPDLVVGNAFGDVLVLLSEGNGVFHQPMNTDQNVGLAVGDLTGRDGPTLIFVDQARDRVIVQNGPQGQPTVLADRSNGLLVPGTPVLADLNGDGIPDLIVPNSGGNNVLVYPGLPGGGFGPSLNNDNGFFTGTNPVSVVVADVNGDGRPDLIVANEGSNDVSILLNKPLGAGAGFTFVQGPRLRVGAGPVGLLYGDFNGDHMPDIMVSDSGSKDLMLLPGLGGGFFNDVDPTIIALTESPGPIFAGPFKGGSNLDIVALDPGSSDVTLISGLLSGAPSSQIFSSGGFDPVAAFALLGTNGFEDLIVANNANGRVALLEGGPDGLTVGSVNSSLAGLGPTGLALASIHDNELEFYAATEGQEAASLLVLFAPSTSSTALGGQGLTLLPLQESSLPLIATLLHTDVDLSASEGRSAEGVAADLGTSGGTAVSLGQGPFGKKGAALEEADDFELASEPEAGRPTVNDRLTWKRVMIGLDEAFEEFRRATQSKQQSNDVPERDARSQFRAPGPPKDRTEPVGRRRDRAPDRMIDAAIDSLSQTSRTPLVTPLRGHDGSERMTKLRFEPGWLRWVAVTLPSGAFLLASARRIRGSRGPGGVPNGRRPVRTWLERLQCRAGVMKTRG